MQTADGVGYLGASYAGPESCQAGTSAEDEVLKMGSFVSLMPEILKVVPGVISVVERLFPGSKRGPEKKAAAITFIKIAVGLGEGALGKDLVQDDLFAEGLSEIIDGSVKVMNSINKQTV